MTDLPRLARQQPAALPGIVHLGPGAFFKAFNAIYTDEAMAAAGGDWGIIAVSLRSDRAARDLNPQEGVYTSVALMPDGEQRHVIHSIAKVLVAPEDPEKVLRAMTDPRIKIVSLTITEKGYCRNPATGALRLEDDGIMADLANPDRPQTAPGFIVEALARRRAAGVPALTVLSCDNLPDNGATVRRIILEFARERDAALHDWIAREVRFPSTMVDRITPATTPDDIARLAEDTGYFDPACVLHEPFRQWVIEDDFVSERPAWELAGAQFVSSVHAHEVMKLRCLNGTHSALAYLGYLAGYETISQTVSDPVFAKYCKSLWSQDILPTVQRPEGEDLPAYVAALMARYCNPAIRHRTWQIAMDGSQKLPQRILGTIRDQLKSGRLPVGLCIAVAAWMRYVGGVDETGKEIDVRDPLAERLKAASDAAVTNSDKVTALLSIEQVFDPDLASERKFQGAVTDAYRSLADNGARATVRKYLDELS